MVFQNYALYPHMNAAKNMGFALKMRGLSKDEIDRRVREAARILGLSDSLAEEAADALGRPAAARRDGAGNRAQPAGVPHGRAALEPRREAARGDAGRDRAPPARPRRDDDLRHPRPDRGDDDGRSRGRDAERVPPAGRRSEGALRAAAQPVRRRVHRLTGDEPRHGRRRASRRRHLGLASARTACGSTRRAREAPGPLGYDGRRSCSESGPRTWRTPRCCTRRIPTGAVRRLRHPRGHGLGGVRALQRDRGAGDDEGGHRGARGRGRRGRRGEDGRGARPREGVTFVARLERTTAHASGNRSSSRSTSPASTSSTPRPDTGSAPSPPAERSSAHRRLRLHSAVAGRRAPKVARRQQVHGERQHQPDVDQDHEPQRRDHPELDAEHEQRHDRHLVLPHAGGGPRSILLDGLKPCVECLAHARDPLWLLRRPVPLLERIGRSDEESTARAARRCRDSGSGESSISV